MTNIEKETIITFNEAEKTAEVFTYRPSIIRQLDTLTEERPLDAKNISDNGAGGRTYEIPKAWVKIRPNRILTEVERQERRMAAMRNLHNQN